MDEFDKILEKMKLILGVNKESEVAKAIGMKPSAFSNRKKSGSIPFTHYIEKATSLSVNLNWLIYDMGPIYKDDESKESEPKIIPMDPAVQMLHEVLEETGVKINEAQKQAVLKILRERLDDVEARTKDDMKDYLNVFGKSN